MTNAPRRRPQRPRAGGISHKLVNVWKSLPRTPPGGVGPGGVSMRQRSSATFNFACAFAVMSTAALAYGIASRPAAQERPPVAAVSGARAETVVVRSDTDRNAAAMKLRAAEESAAADRALFIPAPTYAVAAPARTRVAAAAPIVAAAPLAAPRPPPPPPLPARRPQH